MSKERDVRIRILGLPFVPREKIVANLDAARDRIRRWFVNDETASAEADIRIVRNQLDGRRRDVDGDVFLKDGFVASKKIP